jgi:RNA polymerase sigma-70 factor (ECF subfamily)
MQKIQGLREAGTFRSWLFRIAANLSLNHLRHNSRFVDSEVAGQTGILATSPGVHEALEAGEQAVALRGMVKRLPPKQRVTLELRIYEELSFHDIAAVLAITEGAAKVNFHYAVRRLRELMGHPPKVAT